MTQRLSTRTTNPVTLEPMAPRMKTVYRTALYNADDKLVRSQEAWPDMDNPTLQMIADISALSFQGSHVAGIVITWDSVDIEPPTRRPELRSQPTPRYAVREFGPGFPPVPEYRYEVDSAAGTILTFPKEQA